MVFGKKNKEIEYLREQLAYLRGQLEAMKTPKPPEEIDEDNGEDKISKTKRKLDKLSWAIIERRIKSLEQRLYPNEENETSNINIEQNENMSFDIPTMVKNIPAPIRLAISMMLKNRYGISLDEIIADPTKAIPMLTDIMDTLNNLQTKKQQAEKEGKPFNPYDPTLFVK